MALDVVGETVPLRYLLASPVRSPTVPGSLDRDRVRGMRFDTHASSLGSVAMKLFWGSVWLVVAGVMALWYRRRPSRLGPGDHPVEIAARSGEELLDADPEEID